MLQSVKSPTGLVGYSVGGQGLSERDLVRETSFRHQEAALESLRASASYAQRHTPVVGREDYATEEDDDDDYDDDDEPKPSTAAQAQATQQTVAAYAPENLPPPYHLRSDEVNAPSVLSPGQLTNLEADGNVFDSFRDIHQPPDRAAVLYKWLRPAYDNVQMQLRSTQTELAQSQLNAQRLKHALEASQMAQRRAEAENLRLNRALEIAERERADAASRWKQAQDAATNYEQRAAEAESRRELAAKAAKVLQNKLSRANLALEAHKLPREEAVIAEERMRQIQTDADAIVHHAQAETVELKKAVAAAEADSAAARLALERETSARVSAERHAALLAKEKSRMLKASLKDRDKLANAAKSLEIGDTMSAERLLLPASKSAVFGSLTGGKSSPGKTSVYSDGDVMTPFPGNPGSEAPPRQRPSTAENHRPPRAEASAPAMGGEPSQSVLRGTAKKFGRSVRQPGLRGERVAVALAAGSTPHRSLLPWDKAGHPKKKMGASASTGDESEALAGVSPEVWRKVLGFVPEYARAAIARPSYTNLGDEAATDDAQFRAILSELGPEATHGMQFQGLQEDSFADGDEDDDDYY